MKKLTKKNTIGLTRKKVKLVSYQKNWSIEFKREKNNLEKILGDKIISIEHCGSTSIPNIKAKPVIDILIGVKTVKTEGKMCAKKLNNLDGYYLRSKYFSKNKRFLVAKGNDVVRTHYIHIVKYKGVIWNNLINFKNYLINNPKIAYKYSLLKEKLSTQHTDERKLYTEKKSDFVKNILNKI